MPTRDHIMSIRYLRRPPKPVERKIKPKRGAGKRQPAVLSQPHDAAYFCVMCGREHASGDTGASDCCSAASPAASVVEPTRS